jgi:type VI secretion system protein VasD
MNNGSSHGESNMQHKDAPPCRFRIMPWLIGQLRPGLMIPMAMAVLVSGCFGAKEAKEAKEAADAYVRALTAPNAQRGEEPPGIVRGPEEFALKGVADQRVNLDVNGEPLSVVVRVIQLRDKNEFTRLSFDAAANKSDTELFSKELVSVNEVVLMPGTTQEITDKLHPEARYVGVVGFFRRPDSQYWRMLFDARSVRNEGMIFIARDCYFTPITPQLEPLPGQGAGHAPKCAGGKFNSPTNRPRR